jgi:hypothetical protein
MHPTPYRFVCPEAVLEPPILPTFGMHQKELSFFAPGLYRTIKRPETLYLLGFPAFIGLLWMINWAASIELVAATRMNTGFQKPNFKMYPQKYPQQMLAAPRCPACDAQFLHNHTCNIHSYGISPTVLGTIGVNACFEGLRQAFGTATRSRHVGRVWPL